MAASPLTSVPAHVPARLVHEFDIYDPGRGRKDYFHAIRQLHEDGLPDVFWTPCRGGHWVVLRGEAIVAAFRDAATFSSTRMFVPDEANFESNRLIPLMNDPPEHTAYRRILSGIFAPSRMNKLDGEIREFTSDTIRRLRPSGGCEFMDEFALQVPIVVFLKLLDLPLEHRRQLLDLAAKVVRPADEKDSILQLVIEYLAPVIEERRAHPKDDVLSQLTLAEVDGRRLTTTELHGIASTVLLGGLDSVAASLGFFARFLAENPAARQRLINQPETTRFAVEELMRRFPVTTHGRLVMQDIEHWGAPMRRNDHVIWGASMYNFDHRIFPDPMAVDFDRARTPSMSFGTGIHACLGSFLARIELRVFLEEWLKQIPQFGIRQRANIEYRPGINVGYSALPLAWDS